MPIEKSLAKKKEGHQRPHRGVNLVCRFKTPCKTPFIEFLIVFQPLGCMDETIILGLLYRQGIIIWVVNLPVDHHQLLVYFPWDSDFLNHIWYMRGMPNAGTYKLGFIA